MCYVGYTSSKGSTSDGAAVSSICTETDDTCWCCCKHTQRTRAGLLLTHCTDCHIALEQN